MFKKEIFVFGSNLAGRHGAGSAKFARNNHGAEYGVGVGLTGNSYAIPTKDENIKTLPLEDISIYIQKFIRFAELNMGYRFNVTRIGCGLAGYKDTDIAVFFKESPNNCYFDLKWKDILGNNFMYWGTF